MAFTSNTYTATLDIKRRTPQRPLIIEGDAGVRLNLSLTDNGAAMDITGLYARCVFRRSDGRTVLVSESDDPCPMTITKAVGQIVIDVPRTCFRDGDNFLQVQILDGDPDSGTCLSSTFPLLLRAYNCLLTNEAVEESTEFPILEWLIDALRNIDVTVTTKNPGEQATGTITLSNGVYHLALGIPRGASGQDGQDGQDGENGASITDITFEDGVLYIEINNGEGRGYSFELPYYVKPESGIGFDDLSNSVQVSLSKANTAIQVIPALHGATASAAGTAGIAPAPSAGDQGKYLRGDGTWATPSGGGGEITLDDAVTQNSSNPVKSSGIYAALSAKLSTDGDGSNVTATRNATTEFADIPNTPITLKNLLARLGGYYTEINSKYEKPGSGIPASDLASGVIPTIPVSSVNGQTGAVVLDADDVGAQSPFMTATLTIATTDWQTAHDGATCTKTVTGMTADALVFVKYSDTDGEYTETQGANSMTFTAATTPSEAVTVAVAWFKEASA